jgi:hypothetical protein
MFYHNAKSTITKSPRNELALRHSFKCWCNIILIWYIRRYYSVDNLVTRDWVRRIYFPQNFIGFVVQTECSVLFINCVERETSFWQETENGNDSFSLFAEKICSHQNRGKPVDLMTANSQWPLLLCQQFRQCRCLRIACKPLRLMRKSLSTRQSFSSCLR